MNFQGYQGQHGGKTDNSHPKKHHKHQQPQVKKTVANSTDHHKYGDNPHKHQDGNGASIKVRIKES